MSLTAEVISAGPRRVFDDAGSQTLDQIKTTWPPTVPVASAAGVIGISTSWAYQLLAEGEFPCRTIKIRNRIRVVTASLVSLLETGAAT